MFPLEKGKTPTARPDQRSEFRKELTATMKAMKSGESFVIPLNKLPMFFKERNTWHDSNLFYSSKISKTEARIFKR